MNADISYVPFAALAKNPDALIAGAITRSSDGAATSAPVVWPDGTAGTYTGTPSTSFPGGSIPTQSPTDCPQPRPTPNPPLLGTLLALPRPYPRLW